MIIYHEPFSPVVMETTVPDHFVEICNRAADDVLFNPEKAQQHDWSQKLVGKVHQEVGLIIPDAIERQYIIDHVKQIGLDYLHKMIETDRARKWELLRGNADIVPTVDNIKITSSWIVSQREHDFNPMHHHFGDISGVLYLKLPDGYQAELDEDAKDHAPTVGLIEFMHGEKQEWRENILRFQPTIAKLVVFPSYLHHMVYPFHTPGERRSMAFNIAIERD